jgi:phosphatidylglycerol:prolipoprotein diacylglycerol transferase
MTVTGLFNLTAAVITAAVVIWRMRSAGVATHRALWTVACAAWGGVLGSVAVYWLAQRLELLLVPNFTARPGSTIIGVLPGAILAVALYWRLVGLPFWWSIDRVAVAAPLAHAIGRLGCHQAGCCWGRTTDSWLGVELPDINGVLAIRYPTQLMSAGLDLTLFVLLLGLERWCRRRGGSGWPFDGFLFLLYVMLFCAKRGLMDFLRGSSPALVGCLTLPHIVCGAAVLAAALAMGIRYRSTRASRERQEG